MTMNPTLAEFTRTGRAVPFLGFYYAAQDLTALPPGSFVIVTLDEALALDEGALGGHPAVLYLGMNEVWWMDPFGTWSAHVADARVRLADRGITPAAVMVEEEWLGRIGLPEIRAWEPFRDVSPSLLPGVVMAGLDVLLGVVKQHFPAAYTVDVEPSWNDAPIPGNLDVVGLDPYVPAEAWTREADEASFTTWKLVVGVEILRVVSRTSKPILLVPQAFHYQHYTTNLGIGPSPAQLEWWYRAAQWVPQVVAIGWFLWRTQGGVIGLTDDPARRAQVLDACAYNARLQS